MAVNFLFLLMNCRQGRQNKETGLGGLKEWAQQGTVSAKREAGKQIYIAKGLTEKEKIVNVQRHED